MDQREIAVDSAPVSRRTSGASDVTLKIPRPLYNRIGEIIEGTGFHSVTEFCVFVLRDLVSAPPVAQDGNSREVDVVRSRLRSLGYLE